MYDYIILIDFIELNFIEDELTEFLFRFLNIVDGEILLFGSEATILLQMSVCLSVRQKT